MITGSRTLPPPGGRIGPSCSPRCGARPAALPSGDAPDRRLRSPRAASAPTGREVIA